MPRCEGRPDGPCPGKVNNATVKRSQGDMMLCKNCEIFRFPYLAPNKPAELPQNGITDRKQTIPLSDDAEMLQNGNVEKKLSIPELLCFLENKYDNYPSSVLTSVISNFYREDELVSAEQLIVQCIESAHHSDLTPYLRKRIGDNRAERLSDDIMNIFRYADENSLRCHFPILCAASLARVPDIPHDMLDMTSIRNNMNVVDQLQLLSASVSSLQPAISEINEVSVQTQNLLRSQSSLATCVSHTDYALNFPALLSASRDTGGFDGQMCLSTDDFEGPANVVSMPLLQTTTGDSTNRLLSDDATSQQAGTSGPSLAEVVKKSAAVVVESDHITTDEAFQTVTGKSKKKKIVHGSRKEDSPFSGVVKKGCGLC